MTDFRILAHPDDVDDGLPALKAFGASVGADVITDRTVPRGLLYVGPPGQLYDPVDTVD